MMATSPGMEMTGIVASKARLALVCAVAACWLPACAASEVRLDPRDGDADADSDTDTDMDTDTEWETWG